MSVVVSNLVTCESKLRCKNFQRHKADNPAKLECEETVTKFLWVSLCIYLFIYFVLVGNLTHFFSFFFKFSLPILSLYSSLVLHID